MAVSVVAQAVAVPEPTPQTRSSLVAALILLARELFPRWNGWPSTVARILALVGAGRSQAYEMLGRLRELLPTLIGAPGRPAASAPDQDDAKAVAVAVREYVVAHPGAMCDVEERRTYTDACRRFVVGLLAPGQPGAQLPLLELSHVTGVPAGTLKDWLRASRDDGVQDACNTSCPGASDDEASAEFVTVRNVHLCLIARLWKRWEGTFQGFCQMLRSEHRLKYGDTAIGNFLQCMGLRHRRKRMPVEAVWSSGTFRKLFPGVQWIGDGTGIAIWWGNLRFLFNVEAITDAASDATVGFAVTDAEDEKALGEAYDAGIATTGAPPLALSLDNRPSNHSPGAAAMVPGATVLSSTPGRGQAKAPVEGSFGLFQQTVPPLAVSGDTPREMARCALRLILTAWYRGRNGKPRKRLKDSTPAKAYASARPTPEEIQRAREWIAELQRRQERARLTREARRDPVRLELLTQGLAELGIPDPDRRLAVALACYAPEAIVRGLATFRTKQELGTLPPDADRGRYLGGIIRQLNIRLELDRTSVHLFEQRLRLHDLTLEPLRRAAERLRAEQPPSALPQAYVDRALESDCEVDFRFWGHAAAEMLSALPAASREALYHVLCRRIAATFKAARERREDLIARLVEACIPP